MSENSKPISDPARDYQKALDIFSQASGDTVAERIAASATVTAWSGDFYHVVKLLQETLTLVHHQLIDNEYLDPEDEAHLRAEISNLKDLYSVKWMAGQWASARASSGPAGPEAATFLRSASRQLRSKGSYTILTDSDVKLIHSALENIRADMKGLKLEKADFAREALLRGCDEVSFILSRISVLGFSRLEAPIMELGAFLYTVAEEVRRADGNDVAVKKSMGSLSQVYSRLYELSKIASMAKVGWDGAHWLISHLAA